MRRHPRLHVHLGRLGTTVLAATATLVVAALVALGQTGVPERTDDDLVPTVRYAGTNRFDTAALIATDTSPGAPAPEPGTVVVARGEDFPDALAGSFLAGRYRSQVLLTARDALPDETLDALLTLAPERVIVLGGTAAVSPEVEDELRSLADDVQRIAGPDRFATAAAIARAAPPERQGLEFVDEQGAAGDAEGLYSGPTDVTTGPEGEVYVADQFNQRVQVFTPDGAYLRSFGTAGDGPGQFSNPVGVAVSETEVFVSDFNNNRVQVFSPQGDFLRQWGGDGAGDGQFANPTGISLAPDGTLAVGDDLNFRIQLFAPDGTFLRAIGAEGAGEGQVAGPRGMDHDADGNLWVAERDNNRIQQFAPDGTSLGVITEGSDGVALDQPYDVSVGPDGRLYVADRGNGRIQVLEADGTPVDATAVAGGAAPGFDPIAIGVGADGTILVGDVGNERVLTYRQAGGQTGLLNGLRTAVLATGERASDALVAGPAAYDGGFPLLLTGAAALPQASADVLAELGIEQVIVVGGTAAVSDDVVNAVQQRDVVVQRVSGPDRVATALAFARFTYDQMGFRQDTLNLASGAATAFPDTLSLGPQGGLERGAILLTSGGDTLDEALEAFFTATGPCTVRLLSVAGGTAVVPDAVVDGIRAVVPYEPACEPGPEPTPSPSPGGPGEPGGEPPTEPEEPVGGLTVTPADTSPSVGEELAVEITGADPVRVEVYEEVDDGAGGTSRLLRDAVDATLNGGPYTYTSNAPRTERIVACVVAEGESCTTVTEDPLAAGEVFLRDDVEAIASATVTWTASQLAPLVSGPEGDDDAAGVVHTTVSGDLLCYGIAGVTGLQLPATAATVRDAEGAVVAALSPPAAVGDPLFPGDVGGAAGCVEGVDPAVLSALGGTPEAFTARVDTGEHPDGALAAPFRTASSVGRALALADLSGAALGEDGATAGLGTVSVSVDTTRDLVCAGAFVRGVDLPATALRIHRGGPDGAGPAVLELPPPNAAGEVFGCVGAEGLTDAASDSDLDDLAATPGDYSVVVTTPDGALSGPLVRP